MDQLYSSVLGKAYSAISSESQSLIRVKDSSDAGIEKVLIP